MIFLRKSQIDHGYATQGCFPQCRGRVAAGDLGIGTLHHQGMRVSDVELGERRAGLCQLPDAVERVVVVDGLQMVLESLADDREAVLDDQVGFDLRQGVSLSGSGRVSELEIRGAFEPGQRRRNQRAQTVELRLLACVRDDRDASIVHRYHIDRRCSRFAAVRDPVADAGRHCL